MLILTRRAREALKIGDDVTITVLGVKGSVVSIGIAAPKSVAVHREEVYERIEHERQATRSMAPDTAEHHATTA